MHNAMYDLVQLRRYGTVLPRFIWDTMLVDRAVHSGLYDAYALDDLARRYLGEYMDKTEQKGFQNATEMSPKAKTYAANDAMKTLRIALLQRNQPASMLQVYTGVDAPFIFPALDFQPVRVDVDAWKKLNLAHQAEADRLQGELGINVQSPVQVKTKAASLGIVLPDTAATTLAAWKGTPFIDAVLEARRYRMAVSTYGQKWLENYVEPDGLVYSSWKITGAETGRPSSSNPNMQNIPSRAMPIYRTLFMSKHYKMIVADVSQQEPRILAHFSRDPELMKAFNNGEDLHLYVAKAIFNNPNLTKEKNHKERDIGKVINLATSYGMAAKGLSRKLGNTREDAEAILSKYFMRFRGVFSWIAMQRRSAYRDGYVSTAGGRRVYINPYNNSWENNAINAPIQGSAADFTKTWIRNIWELSNERGVPYSVMAMVHDEVLLDPEKKDLEATLKIEADAFEMTALSMFPTVPFKQDVETGRRWSCKSAPETDEEEINDEEE